MYKPTLKKFILSGVTTGVIASGYLSADAASMQAGQQQNASSASKSYSDADRTQTPARSGMMDSNSPYRSNRPFDNKMDQDKSSKTQSEMKDSYSNRNAPTARNSYGTNDEDRNGPRGRGGSCGAIALEDNDQQNSQRSSSMMNDRRSGMMSDMKDRINDRMNDRMNDRNNDRSSDRMNNRSAWSRQDSSDGQMALWGWGEDDKQKESAKPGAYPKSSGQADTQSRYYKADQSATEGVKTWPSSSDSMTPRGSGMQTKSTGASDGQLALEDDYSTKKPPSRLSNQPGKILNGNQRGCNGKNGCGS